MSVSSACSRQSAAANPMCCVFCCWGLSFTMAVAAVALHGTAHVFMFVCVSLTISN